MLTIQDILNAKRGEVFHDLHHRAWRVSGKVKTWKTRPGEFRLPVKFGLYSHDTITESELVNLHRGDGCVAGTLSGNQRTIYEAVQNAPDGLNLRELVEATGIPAHIARRSLNALVKRGGYLMVVYDPERLGVIRIPSK
jgi:hypothetical protein